jgi:quercetin dioxygenase-like cupin family protein
LKGEIAMSQKPERQALIRNIAEVPWDELPGHFGGALSKLLVHPETTGSRHVDHRISTYQPKAYVAPHTHRIQEQVYHVLAGQGCWRSPASVRWCASTT